MPIQIVGGDPRPLRRPGVSLATPGHRNPKALAQSELASVFDKNGKGVSMATPGHRRGGQRTPAYSGRQAQILFHYNFIFGIEGFYISSHKAKIYASIP
jgi:hypothetical protein